MTDASREPAEPAGGVPSVLVRHAMAIAAAGGLMSGTLAAFIAASAPLPGLALAMALAGAGACVLASQPRAALLHSTVTAIGALAGLAVAGEPSTPIAAILLAGGITALHRLTSAAASARRQLRLGEAALQEARETASLLTDLETESADWLWRIDADGRITQTSQRFLDASGLPAHLLDGGSLAALFAPPSAARLEALLRERKPFRDETLQVQIGAHHAWWSLTGHPTADGGWRGVCSDITRSHEAEARMAHVAEIDSLTGLANRAALVRALDDENRTIAAGGSFALVCIDLDNFKAVNDTMGHPAGDAFLKTVARRLRDCVGADALLARLGGDEFAVILRDISREDAGDVAEVIVDALLAPVALEGRQILAGGSVGVAMAPDDGADPALLMKNAELALYRAKAQGRGCARFFEAGMEEDARTRASLEADLRSALQNDTMDVYFQPLVSTATRKVTGYETLLRWNRPGHGLVSPAVFIACAEETGVIVPLGEWVIRKAVHEAAQWRDDVAVAVNLSPAQIRNPSLLAAVVGALAASQLDPSRLEIEITESVLMDETEQTLRTLHALRDLGVQIALDDFGTGYSSLSYLRAFPFDKIKIDQRFVQDIVTSIGAQSIVRAVISLARDLGMRVTAEGVENEQQAAVLASLGCPEVQGYLYSRPLPAAELAKKDAAASSARILALRRRA